VVGDDAVMVDRHPGDAKMAQTVIEHIRSVTDKRSNTWCCRTITPLRVLGAPPYEAQHVI